MRRYISGEGEMKNLRKSIPKALTIISIFAVALPLVLLSARVAYAQEPRMFSDPSIIHGEETLHLGDKFTFDVKLENRPQVNTISFSLHYDPKYVNITKITPNPNNELPGGSFLIGDWFLDTGNITDILYGYLGGYWDITTAVSVVRVEVQIMNFTPSIGTVIDIYAMNCWDDPGYNFLVGDCPYDLTFYYPYETLSHTVTADSQTFTVQTRANSTVTNFNFSQTGKSITFNVTGTTGTTGWVNITIPKVLLDGEWIILIDNAPATYIKTENETDTFLYINYTHSTHAVTIIGTTVVPEYMPQVMLITLIIATIALALIKRKVYIPDNKRILSKR